MRIDAVAPPNEVARMAHHVIRCLQNQEMRVHNALDDVGINVGQALPRARTLRSDPSHCLRGYHTPPWSAPLPAFHRPSPAHPAATALTVAD